MTISEVYTEEGKFFHTFGSPKTVKPKFEKTMGKLKWVKESTTTYEQIKEYGLPFIF